MNRVGIRDVLDRHDGVLLDAYGVLVDARGVLPGARALIEELERRRVPWAVVTNDASRLNATYATRFAALGLPIDGSRVVSSGSLLPGYFRESGLQGARCAVLGTDDSMAFVREGGGVVVPLSPGLTLDAIVVADDAGFPFVEGIDAVIGGAIRALDEGRRPALILPNPDLVYPKGHGELGITAGAIALVIESILARRNPGAPRFVHLGKPMPRIFLEASRRIRVPPDRIVMVGDQIETDIAGALNAGMSAALVEGVSRLESTTGITPTYLLESISP